MNVQIPQKLKNVFFLNKFNFLGMPIVVFTPHVQVYFWPNIHTFGDIELKFTLS